MYKKIDIYLKNTKGLYQYECSTTQRKNCNDAKKAFLRLHNYLSAEQVKAFFVK